MSSKVVHFEIPADDVERAQEFYREAFGWTVTSMPGMGYTLLGTTPVDETGAPAETGGINGGMLARQDPVTAPVITIDVEDIDAALRTVERLGGTVTRSGMPVGDMGYAAYFTDTEGNVLGLWQTATG